VKRPPPQLIAEWYAKLRAAGFRDVEGATTFTARMSRPACVVSWPRGFEPSETVADHPTAVYYRGLEHVGRALKGKTRKLVIAASNEGASAASRGLRMSRRTASYQVRQFAIETGLLREAQHGGD
jgi:hypothetical protein